MATRNWEVVNQFKGYRNREDPTNLEPGTMVFGSKNVLTNLSDRVGNRPGYVSFGQSYTDIAGVVGSFDLLDVPTTITERHLKSWGVNIEVLWEGFDEQSSPLWNNLFDTSSSPYYNFSNFWEGDIQKQWTLGVNNGDSLWAWNNAMAGFLSSTATTITKQGVTSWQEEGFDSFVSYVQSVSYVAATTIAGAQIIDASNGFIAAGFQIGQTIVITGTASNDGTYVIASVTAGTITIVNSQDFTAEAAVISTIVYTPSFDLNGVTYTYTGGETTTTLTGVSALPVGVAGDMVVQTPQVYPLTYMYGLAFTTARVIGVDASQLYLGSADSSVAFFSKLDNFFDYTFAATGRIASDGGQLNLDAPPTAIVKQDGEIYISSGKNEWGRVVFETSTVTVGGQQITIQPVSMETIKTTVLQSAISQGAVAAIENNLAFLSFSQQGLILGKTQFQEGEQTSFYMNDTMTELSAPVVYDFNALDFTDATVFYDDSRKYVLHSFPRSGVVMIYNNNTDQQYWEAPQEFAFGRFATIHGQLYAHGYLTPTTYKMFTDTKGETVWNDDGGAIDAWAFFAFQNYGYRVNLKHDTGTFVEGYISSNTTLMFGTKYEQQGCGKEVTDQFIGSDGQFVCLGTDHQWLGNWSLGKQGLATVHLPTNSQNLPPSFSIISTLSTPQDFRIAQNFFHSNGIDFQWQVVAFARNVFISDKIPVAITR